MSNILILSPWLSRAGGGLQSSVRDLVISLENSSKDTIRTLGLNDKFFNEDKVYWGAANVTGYDYIGPESFRFSTGLLYDVICSNTDLIQLHGVWMSPSFAVRLRNLIRRDTPFIINPHGMLDPWILNRNLWKKQLAKAVWESSNWRKAKAFRALNVSEAVAIRAVSPLSDIVVIPNGVVPADDAFIAEANAVRSANDPVVIFLGRLHEKKCILELIQAWKNFRQNYSTRWQLQIAGWGDAEYEQKVIAAINELNDPTIKFVGAVFGQKKAELLKRASAFILPSLSEGLPVAVLEAAGYGLYPIITPECNLPDFFTNELALKINTNISSIVSGFVKLNEMAFADVSQFGQKGRSYVRQKYEWTTIANDFNRVHNWLLRGSSKPTDLLFPK